MTAPWLSPLVRVFDSLNQLDEWIRSLSWWQLILFWAVLALCTYLFLYVLQLSSSASSKLSARKRLERNVKASEMEGVEPETYVLPDFKRYSWRELKEYNGQNRKPILVAVRGKVYDMTSHWTGRILYGEGSSYFAFAGNDATRALATLQFDQVNRKDWDTLTSDEQQTLREWEETYRFKYKIVGELLEDPDDPPMLLDEEEVVEEISDDGAVREISRSENERISKKTD